MFRLVSFILLMISSVSGVFSQKDSISVHWKKKEIIEIGTSTTWDVSALHQLIISNNDRIYKYDSTGKMLFQASTKSLGRIAQIDARNPMKILIFSQQQQIISYLDNTLTTQQSEIELMDLQVSFGTVVCTSNQPDKFWVYDQDNSKLLLLGTQKQLQNQSIENINGLLGIQQFDQLKEVNEYLFSADYRYGIYQFDRFGTLIDRWNWTDFDYFDVINNYLYILKKNTLHIIDLKTNEITEIKIPISDEIEEFRIRNEIFYFRTKEKIWKTQVEIGQK